MSRKHSSKLAGAVPCIPGVEFKLLPDWPGYAVSSDGHIWNGRGGRWRKMTSMVNTKGEQVVMLLRADSHPCAGGQQFKVAELVHAAFG